MAASLVQSGFTSALGSTSVSVILGAAPTKGNLLVAVLTSNSGVTTPVHPWSSAPDVLTGAATNSYVYSKVAGAAESATITFSNSASRNLSLTVMEFAPSAGKAWFGLDQSAVASGSAVNGITVGPTAGLAAADDVAVAGVATSAATGSSAPSMSGFTVTGGLSAIARGFAGYAILASNAAAQTTAAWVTASNAGAVLATYKQGVPAAGNPGFLALL